MSVGIEAWVRAEDRSDELQNETDHEFVLNELAVDADGHQFEILAYHDDETFAVFNGDDIVPVPMSVLYPAPHGAFAVTVEANDGGDTFTRYFGSERAALNYTAATEDTVVGFEGLMD